MPLNIDSIREDFPALQRVWNGKPLVYLDNAATTLKPRQVIEAVTHYYSQQGANVNRGIYKLAEESTRSFEEARKKVASLIRAKERELVFTRSTTEGINLVMNGLLRDGFFEKRRKILISEGEHHSNIVPWQYLKERHGIRLEVVPVTKNGELDKAEMVSRMDAHTALVSVADTFNTNGSVNPVEEIVHAAHVHNALTLVDAAQGVGHHPIDLVNKLDTDFLVFSAHKMLGPTGIGALYGKETVLEELPAFQLGGDMIEHVSWEKTRFAVPPTKFEAGTPNIAGAIGFGEAASYLSRLGMENVQEFVHKLGIQGAEGLEQIEGVRVYRPLNTTRWNGTFLFSLKGWECHDVALALDESSNIAIRSGMMCAEPFIRTLDDTGLCRVSPYLYNTPEEMDQLVQEVKNLAREKTNGAGN